MPFSLVSAPSGEPVDLEFVKLQCSLEGIDEKDGLLTDIVIPAARDRGEKATRRQWMTATWDWLLDGFPCSPVLEVPKPPLRSVTYIKYYDTAGVLQTMSASDYQVQTLAGPRCGRGRIALTPFVAWPLTQSQKLGAVIVRFVCGYGEADDVPAQLKKAMLMDISSAVEFTENIITGTITSPVPDNAAEVYRSYKSYGTQFDVDEV